MAARSRSNPGTSFVRDDGQTRTAFTAADEVKLRFDGFRPADVPKPVEAPAPADVPKASSKTESK